MSSNPQLTSTQRVPTPTGVITNVTSEYDIVVVTDLQIVYTISMMSLLLLSVLGNIVVLTAVLMSKKLTENRSTFYFVASLASDMLMATFSIPFKITIVLNITWSESMCYIYYMMDVFCNIASIINLFLVSTDRFIAVHMPYRYQTILSKSHSKRLICGAWCFAAVWSLLGMFRWDASKPILVNMCAADNHNYHLASFIFYGLILVIMAAQYSKILQVVIRQIREIDRNTPQIQPSPEFQRGIATKNQQIVVDSRGRPSVIMLTTDSEVYVEKLLKKKRKSRLIQPLTKRLRKELKATKSIAIVFLAFCITWLPSFVFVVITFIDGHFFLRNLNITTIRVLIFAFVHFLPMINTMVNPIIYSFSNTQFRKAVDVLWRKLLKKAPRKLSWYAIKHSSTSTSGRTASTAMTSKCYSVDDNTLSVNV